MRRHALFSLIARLPSVAAVFQLRSVPLLYDITLKFAALMPPWPLGGVRLGTDFLGPCPEKLWLAVLEMLETEFKRFQAFSQPGNHAAKFLSGQHCSCVRGH
ncbi:hypothetical protein KCU81_g591, partial [Aureobasidium melanogenum]